MTHSELGSLLRNTTSRSIYLTGLGCLYLYVPVGDVTKVTNLMNEVIPVGIELQIHSLKKHKIFMKKRLHEVGMIGNIDEYKSFNYIVDKILSEGVVINMFKLTFKEDDSDKIINYMDEVKIFENYSYSNGADMGGVIVFTFQNEFDMACVEDFHLTGER